MFWYLGLTLPCLWHRLNVDLYSYGCENSLILAFVCVLICVQDSMDSFSDCTHTNKKRFFMTNFSSFGFSDSILQGLNRQNIVTPTEIQEKALPVALNGSDVMASSETGSGKTIAYLVPLINHLLKSKNGLAVVLAPTRELAAQVKKSAEMLMDRSMSQRIALLIGGQSIFPQLQSLKRGVNLVIGTPGRVNDHIDRGTLDLSNADFLVLDEMDRMLDIGFARAIDMIISEMPSQRQTLMFSATIAPSIEKLSQKYLKQPVQISINSGKIASPLIKQEVFRTAGHEKFTKLLTELETREGSIIIFVKTKMGAEKLADKLKLEDFKAAALHGDLRQNRRDQIVRAFREEKIEMLVATDIAARGLDISHIRHVVNYDLPQCPEDYVHRIGRTGRAGVEGCAVSFVAPDESHKWRMIVKLLGSANMPFLEQLAGDGNFSERGGGARRSFSGGARRASGGFGNSSSRSSRNFGWNGPRSGSSRDDYQGSPRKFSTPR